MINVSPLAVVPYDSVWDNVTADVLYIPSHLLVDSDGTNDQLSSSSTLDSAPSFLITGTDAGDGVNPGWFTGTASGDLRIQVADDAAVDAMMRTDTMSEGDAIVISCHVYIPAGGITTGAGLVAYGRAAGAAKGFYANINAAEKPAINMITDDLVSVVSGVGSAITVDSNQHLFFVLQRTATGFQNSVYQDGVLTQGADTAGDGYAPIATAGLNIYSNVNSNGSIFTPLEADMKVSDVIIARTSGDKSSHFAELATRQSRVRTSLVRKWADVL